MDRWAAAQVVANLMTARMKQFERLVADGLPALCEQQGLDAAASAALRGRARLLRDYMAGVLAWHRATPRYTDTGLRATYLGFQSGRRVDASDLCRNGSRWLTLGRYT